MGSNVLFIEFERYFEYYDQIVLVFLLIPRLFPHRCLLHSIVYTSGTVIGGTKCDPMPVAQAKSEFRQLFHEKVLTDCVCVCL